ncbi:hypothetical protein EDD21DRAFT_440688 [Dissophora ornata]|nr:hypothetical protein EDD21DRAFT_440688 [Dissophora ornata]
MPYPSIHFLTATLFIRSILSLAICTLLSTYSHAQSFQPTTTGLTNNNFIEGQALYIQGGRVQGSSAALPQAFKIDLSVSWPINNPVYVQLPNGPSLTTATSALSADKKSWFLIGTYNSTVFNFQALTWSSSTVSNPYVEALAFGTATNPVSGHIYTGVNTVVNSITASDLMSFAPTGSNLGVLTEESSLSAPYLTQHHIAWSDAVQRVLIFGGSHTAGFPFVPQVSLTFDGQLYDPTTKTRSSFAATGDVPSNRFEACFVPAYNGTKIILYGGATFATQPVFLNDVYILDVTSGVWTQGLNAGEARGGVSCAISNDQLIIWGGFTNQGMSTQTLVYNIKTNVWTTNYTLPAATTTVKSTPTASSSVKTPATGSGSASSSPSNNTPPTQSSGSSHTVVILGATVGALVLVVVAGALLYRARSSRIKVVDFKLEPENFFNQRPDRNDSAASASDLHEMNNFKQPPTSDSMHQSLVQHPSPMNGHLHQSNTQYYPPPPQLNPDSSVYWAAKYKDDSGLRGPASIPKAPSHIYPSLPAPAISRGSAGRPQEGIYGSTPEPMNPQSFPPSDKNYQSRDHGGRHLSQHPHGVLPSSDKTRMQRIPYGDGRYSLHPHGSLDGSTVVDDPLDSYFE